MARIKIDQRLAQFLRDYDCCWCYPRGSDSDYVGRRKEKDRHHQRYDEYRRVEER